MQRADSILRNLRRITFHILVISVAPKIAYDAQYKQPVALNAGSTLTLPVTVSGVPTPKVSWYFGEKELKPGNGTSIETKENTSKLTIKNTTGANAGAYQVKAENAAGSDKAEFKVSMKGDLYKTSCFLLLAVSVYGDSRPCIREQQISRDRDETETFQKYVARPRLQDRDYIPAVIHKQLRFSCTVNGLRIHRPID